uniref:Uncharacterized protein n=1 Tax=Anguilla anguilla TaxID=7936 RepID=A0A0E9Q4M0_ANGAN
MDKVASRKPSPELNVKTTKQMRKTFGRVNSLKKESVDGTASKAGSIYMLNGTIRKRTQPKLMKGSSYPND